MSVYKEDIKLDTTSGELSINGRPEIQFYKNYLFPQQGGESVKIETLNSQGPNLNIMDSVVYFYNKLRQDSKIPYNRFSSRFGVGSNNVFKTAADGAERDEVRFAKFITRLRSIFQEIVVKPLWIQMCLDFPALVACGGFSYGDVLGGGGGWAKSILYHDEIQDMFAGFFVGDRVGLGICNGCQMFAQIRDLIPGAEHWPRFVRNRSEQFEGRTVLVRINASESPWLADMSGSVIPVAVAHGEGRAEFDDAAAAADFWRSGQASLQYVDNAHQITERYPANPNGAEQGLAGISAADGRVLAMMPHPERVFRAYTNPWRDPSWQEDGPWMKLFRNARAALDS